MAIQEDTAAADRIARGQRIRWAREIFEPNRYEFARKLEVDPSTIRNVENGTRNPSVKLLERICHCLEISSDYVLNGRLIGVNPELAGMLVARHPELAPTPTSHQTRRIARTGSLDSTSGAEFALFLSSGGH